MVSDLSRNYQPPGVYIDETDTTLVNAVGIPPTLVAIVGPAQGFSTQSEQVPFGVTVDGETEAVRLGRMGIDIDSVEVVVSNTGNIVPATDYTLTEVGGVAEQDFYVELLPGASPGTAVGTAVFVTYEFTDPDYYNPRSFSSFEEIKDVYGEPLNTAISTPGDPTYQYVLSPVSLAALVAFQNGATEAWIVAAEPPPASATSDAAKSTERRAALKDAYAKLDSNAGINVLVAVTTGIAEADAPGALVDLKNTLFGAANDGFYRFGLIGFDPTVTTEPDDLLGTSGAKYRRMMVAYSSPAGLLMYSGGANTSFAVGHQYLAAAYAGRMSSLPVQYSLTKQVLSGFSGVAGTPLSNSLKNQYASSGIAIAEVDRFSQLVVRHGVTTDPTNLNTRESAVVRAKDALVIAMQTGMDDSGLIGAPIDADLLLNIKGAVQGILEQAVEFAFIVAYSGLAIRQTSSDPSVVEVKFAYKPAYPLNYIVISFSIDMSTGVVANATDENAA